MKKLRQRTKSEVKKLLSYGGSGVVLPINREIRAKNRILNFWSVKRLLEKSRVIAVGKCGCRMTLKNCNYTLEGCLWLNKWGEIAIKEGYAKKSNCREALSILKKTYDEGLVLVAGTEDPPVKICSCCPCCCFQFAGQFQFKFKNSLIKSAYRARVDKDLCKSCGACVERCHFGAMVKSNCQVVFKEDKCFGCGLCVGKCPNNAIVLEKI